MWFETGIQWLINSTEQGGIRRLSHALFWALLASGVLFVHARTQFRGLNTPEAMDCAQIAVNLANGQGFSTHCIRPADLAFLDHKPDQPRPGQSVPDIRHAPLYPAALSLLFRLSPPPRGAIRQLPYRPETRQIIPLSMAFYALTAILLYALGGRLISPRAGIVAAASYLTSQAVLERVTEGAGLPMAAALVTASLWAATLAAAAGERSPWRAAPLAAAAGVLAGLAMLTRYTAGLGVPVVALFLAGRAGRRAPLWTALFIATAALTVTPWLARNVSLSGHLFGTAPLALVKDTYLIASPASMDRLMDPPLSRPEVLPAVGLKFLRNLGPAFGLALPASGAGFLLAFLLVSLFIRNRDERGETFKWTAALGMALALAAQALVPDGAALAIVLPVVILAGTWFFFELMDQTGSAGGVWEAVLAGVLVATCAAPMLLQAAGGKRVPPYPPYSPPTIQYVCARLEPGELLVTDIPWAAAWYGRRSAVLLPVRISAIEKLSARLGRPIGGLYLTQETGNRRFTADLIDGQDREWLPLLARRIPDAFPYTHGISLPPGRRDQIFLSDRPRWEEH